MKTELRLADHTLIPGAKICEIWFDGEFIGQITGYDGPGVRVISKWPKSIIREVLTVSVRIDLPEKSP